VVIFEESDAAMTLCECGHPLYQHYAGGCTAVIVDMVDPPRYCECQALKKFEPRLFVKEKKTA